MTSDGFQLTWCVKIENGPIPVGKMYLNSISKMLKFGGSTNNTLVNPSLADLDADSDNEDETSGTEKPTFDCRCKIFELDPCDGYGKVCLVYKENKTGGTDPKIEVWFLDRALRWHYIAESFTAYYRLMIMHLGLPQWQYAFTDIGLCQQAKQWFNMYAPLRLELDAEIGMPGISRSESSTSTTQIDVGKVFKGKSDKKKPVPAQTQSQQSQSLRKKPTVASAKVGQQPGLKTSSSASQLAGKK
ncbi:tubulin polyglutamylase complex subunit 2-like isoform X2 [Ruditapes philippinarum]|nr:tubulin polyglutamylase complex subunit 2-like isoform X2 [Ruditapes philippinarum]